MNDQLTAERVSALNVLTGNWELVASVGGQPLGLGRFSSDWIEGGAFLRQHGEAGEPLAATPPEWIANSPFPMTTPSSRASSRDEGSRSPTRRRPLRIASRNCRSSWVRSGSALARLRCSRNSGLSPDHSTAIELESKGDPLPPGADHLTMPRRSPRPCCVSR
jgi:hypothetical protein